MILLASFLTFACLPVNKGMEILDFNVGVFFLLAASSIGVVGILLAGWSSNNKFSLIGAMRSGAQIISYELSAGMSILTMVVLAGTMQISEIVGGQAVALNLRYAGYEYMLFDDGKAAADALSNDHAYDLALLDIMLPGMDGFALFSYMEKYHIPVIYMTAKTDSESEVRGLRDGAEDYIVKPFEVITLLVRIEKVLERFGRLNQVYRFRDIVLDAQNRIVTKAGSEMVLTPLEFDVFRVLIKNKNRTVSRDRLLNEIWGEDYFGDLRTVDVRIANIRKKLGFTDEIRTISKAGYRLEER